MPRLVSLRRHHSQAFDTFSRHAWSTIATATATATTTEMPLMKLPLAGSSSLETRGCEKPTNHSCHSTQHQPQPGSRVAYDGTTAIHVLVSSGSQ